MAHKTGAKGNARNFGLHGGGPGKGSKDRTTDRKKFNANFDEIAWTVTDSSLTAPSTPPFVPLSPPGLPPATHPNKRGPEPTAPDAPSDEVIGFPSHGTDPPAVPPDIN